MTALGHATGVGAERPDVSGSTAVDAFSGELST